MRIIDFDKQAYKKQSVLKAIYSLSNIYSLKLEITDDRYCVFLESASIKENIISELKIAITTRVNDFELRYHIAAETKEVKLLLLAKALSSGGIYDDLADEIWK
ncbi:MAG: His-Xaa-Ser system protein HxsD [Roseivirga sp.]|nr:His-Xaa-Ser system protein HxsD [Roseivirga sp.]